MSLTDLLSPGFILSLAQTVAIVALWLRKPGEDAGHEARALRARLDVHEERLKHVATTSEMGELEGDVKEIAASLSAIEKSQARTQNAVERLETFLRDNH